MQIFDNNLRSDAIIPTRFFCYATAALAPNAGPQSFYCHSLPLSGNYSMNHNELNAVAKAMTGKAILAADESSPTIKKRFDMIDIVGPGWSPRRRNSQTGYSQAGM